MKKVQKTLPRTLTKKITKATVTNPDKKVSYRHAFCEYTKELVRSFYNDDTVSYVLTVKESRHQRGKEKKKTFR